MKILIIDDDPAMIELLKILLAASQAEVLTALNGRDGLEIAKSQTPDVILLDLMMPEMDGWEVCKQVRSFSNVPIIVLSAMDSPGTVASALDAGADDYLIKPVPGGVLNAHINRMLRRSGTQPNAAAVAIV